MIGDFSLLFLQPCTCNTRGVRNLVKIITKSNVCVFPGIEGKIVEFSKIAATPLEWYYFKIVVMEWEKYMKDDDP
jgi:hypothetical protein